MSSATVPSLPKFDTLPQPDDVLLSKLRIERVLGEGGMSVVYAARHELLDIPVALKVLHPDYATDDLVRRFFAEAKIAARIASDHVCRVLDLGLLDDGLPYIVMERLEGMTLERHFQTRGAPLPIGEAVDLTLHALEGLAHAHGEGVVHRDIKPENLFLSLSPRRPAVLKLIDFGISKSSLLDGVTMAGKFMGSPCYAAPEQITDPTTTDARTDVWSIGVVLYEMLTARLPFDGTSLDVVLNAIIHDPPPPIPNAPGSLAALIHRCLSKSRDDRPSSVLELAVLLAPFAAAPQMERLERIAMALSSDPSPASIPSTIPAPAIASGIRALSKTRRLPFPLPATDTELPLPLPRHVVMLLAFAGAFLGTAAVIAMYLLRR